MQIFSRFRQPLIWLVCSAALLPVGAPAQTNAPASAPASLSAAAQETVNKGILAAKQQDYLLAIRYFQDARKITPDAPELYFDLGLAESKIPGRELRAIAWFGAYLAANPNAPNAAAVRDQIDALDVKGQGNVLRVLKSVQDQANQKGINSSSIYPNLIVVARLWAEAGDIAAALSVADQIEGSKSQAQAAIARVQIRAGEFARALKTVSQIEDAYWKSLAQAAVAEAQVKAGLDSDAKSTLAAALKTANPISTDFEKAEALAVVAEALMRAGNIADAQTTWANALKAANQIQMPVAPGIVRQMADTLTAMLRSKTQIAIALTQVKAGDFADARGTLAVALKTADQIPRDGQGLAGETVDGLARSIAQETIARLQAKAGDIAGALKTAGQIQRPYIRSPALAAIADTQFEAGDIAGAKSTLEAALKATSQNQNAKGKSRALIQIAGVLARLGDIVGAKNTLAAALKTADQIEYPDARSLVRTMIAEAGAEVGAEAQIRAGNNAGAIDTLMAALKTFDQIQDEDAKIRAQVNVARVLVNAGDIADANNALAAVLNTVDQMDAVSGSRTRAYYVAIFAKLDTATSKTVTQAPVVASATASDWIRKLDDTFVYGGCPLNTDLFLDLAGYLRALPSSGDPDEVFIALSDTATKIITAQNAVDKILRQ